jgi:hypothetical protein
MSLFEDASLIVTPNAVKEGKLFSIKPTDGSGDLSVVRATTKTRVNSLGVIESVPINVASLDYSNGSCPSILVEPQRTNLALYSEQFDNASWTKLATTIIPNTETSPSNVINSDTLIADGSLNTHFFAGTFAVTSGVTYTISIFVKKNTNNFFQLFGSGTIWGTDFFANFDLENGVLGTVGSSAIASIENIQNQWYRCSIRGTALVSGAGFSTAFSLITSANSPRAQQNTLSTSVFIWGAQLEAGSNATSYIPTVASAVTRNADVISKTGLSGITTITETFENGTTNVISGSPTSYTMSQGRIKQVIGV